MYNTNDEVNGISTKECFYHLLDGAFELQEKGKNEEANKYFNVIATCLGIDFRMQFEVDPYVLNWIEISELTKNSFEFSEKHDKESMHEEINRIFESFDTMVKNGYFSNEYYQYLLNRKTILQELIDYQNAYIATTTNLNGKKEATTKLEILENTLACLNSRLSEVSLSFQDKDNSNTIKR